jgi:signal recognition particle receptor subunit beta
LTVWGREKMASINYAFKEISCKIVYYGPGLSGKTTNLQYVHQKIPPQTRGDLISLATDQDRTLYFDFLPVNIGKVHGFSTKFQLYTVPGQVYYNATRKLVLRGVDGLVFVADSQKSKMDENLESYQNLLDNLAEYGYNLDKLPLVLQYNKRDLTPIISLEELQRALNPRQLPYYEAVAVRGVGVFDTLKCISKMVLDQAKRKQLFPQREMEEKDSSLAPADLSPVHTEEPIADAIVSTSLTEVMPDMTATAVAEKEPVSAEEKVVPEPVTIPEETKPEIEIKIEEITEKNQEKTEMPISAPSPTIISWSAGKKTRSKGFFLWRFLGRIINR